MNVVPVAVVPSQSAHQLDIEWYHNVYKDMYGIRPRHIDFSRVSDSMMQVLMDDLRKASAQASEDAQWEFFLAQEEAQYAERMGFSGKLSSHTDKFGDVFTSCRYCGGEGGCGC